MCDEGRYYAIWCPVGGSTCKYVGKVLHSAATLNECQDFLENHLKNSTKHDKLSSEEVIEYLAMPCFEERVWKDLASVAMQASPVWP